MKTLITIMILVVIVASSALGGNVDYLNNRSANYFRNFARAAATDAPDIISYNPAGVSSLGEGFHISFGNQFIMKEFVVEATPFWDTTAVEYTDTEPTLFLPDF